MPIGLKRFQQTGNLHFITFSCYRRLPYLEDPESKNILERIIEKTRRSHNLAIYAYVLMPEHVHLLTDEAETHALASFLRVVKGESSKLLKGTRARIPSIHSASCLVIKTDQEGSLPALRLLFIKIVQQPDDLPGINAGVKSHERITSHRSLQTILPHRSRQRRRTGRSHLLSLRH